MCYIALYLMNIAQTLNLWKSGDTNSSQTAYHENDLARHFVWTFTDPALTKDK